MKIEPFVLIGGASKRFGRDKATFIFDGERLADRAARIAEAALGGVPCVFVASGLNANFQATEGRLVINDIGPGRGAIGAVHTALANAKSQWLFVLACDLPFVTSELISFLGRRISDGVNAVVPVQPDGRWQPLCAVYRVEPYLPVFERAVRTEGRLPSLRATIGEIGADLVPADEIDENFDPAVLRNVNSPEDIVDRLDDHP